MNNSQYSSIISRIKEFVENEKKNHKRPEVNITIENGRGETYRNDSPTIYAHGEYSNSSVLAGQPLRQYIDEIESWSEVPAFIAAVKAEMPKLSIESLDGTTHIPSEQILDAAGLHDED